METQPNARRIKQNDIVFIHTPKGDEKYNLLYERDNLFQQYIDVLSSIQAWTAKVEKIKAEWIEIKVGRKSQAYNSKIVQHLEGVRDELRAKLLELDAKISPFQTL